MYTSIFLSFFVSKLWKKEEKSQIGNVPADWLLIPYAIGDVLGPFWIRIIGYVMNAGNTCPLWQRIRKMKGCGADVAKEKKEINPISQSVFFCSLPPLLDVCCWCCCRNSLATVLLFFGSTNLLLFFWAVVVVAVVYFPDGENVYLSIRPVCWWIFCWRVDWTSFDTCTT